MPVSVCGGDNRAVHFCADSLLGQHRLHGTFGRVLDRVDAVCHTFHDKKRETGKDHESGCPFLVCGDAHALVFALLFGHQVRIKFGTNLSLKIKYDFTLSYYIFHLTF